MRKTGLFLMTALVAGLTMFTSCNNDNGVVSPTFETPAYEDVSAKYEVSGSSLYKSFELTASGNYVIVKKTSYLSASKLFFGRMDEATRATSSGDIIYGKFTKKSDTEFELEGFGSIVIEGGTDNVVSLKITPNGGTTMTLPAQRVEQKEAEENSFTSKICRTWSVASYRYTIVLNGSVFFDGEYATLEDLVKALTNKAKSMGASNADELFDVPYDETPEQILFSKSGTYLVVYKNSTLGVSTWQWKDENKGILHYSWNYDDMYDSNSSGDVHLSWRNSQLAVKEVINASDAGYDIGYSLTITIVTYLNEVK